MTAEYTVWQLARMAGVSDPDSETSPGANFLRAVEVCAAEQSEYGYEDLSDAVHEIADGCVPVYTHERWKAFVDLAAYDVDTSDLTSGADLGMTELAGIALYEVGRNLANALLSETGEVDDA